MTVSVILRQFYPMLLTEFSLLFGIIIFFANIHFYLFPDFPIFGRNRIAVLFTFIDELAAGNISAFLAV